jgi:hypothetical protein
MEMMGKTGKFYEKDFSDLFFAPGKMEILFHP